MGAIQRVQRPSKQGAGAQLRTQTQSGPRGLAILRAAMNSSLATTLPFFALVLCGCLAARQGVLAAAAIPGLNRFVLFFALPCLLFRFGMNTPVVDLLNPAPMFALGRGAMALGLPLTRFQLTVLTLAAALPSASNVSMLAERYGADNDRMARIILASTALAFGTFTGLAWLMI